MEKRFRAAELTLLSVMAAAVHCGRESSMTARPFLHGNITMQPVGLSTEP
jgi:hypothetical protein